MSEILTFESRVDRSLQMPFENQLKILGFYHLEEHVSTRHMLQVLEQLLAILEKLSQTLADILPDSYSELGSLAAIDDSLITSTLFMGTTKNTNQSQKPGRLVGYHVAGVAYWIATDPKNPSTRQFAEIYKPGWQRKGFFAWWKRYLRRLSFNRKKAPYGVV